MSQSTSAPQVPTIVLAAVDGSELSELVVQQAATLASAQAASLHVLHVVDSIPVAAVSVGGSPFALPGVAQLLEEARKHLEKLVAQARAKGIETYGHLKIGTPVSSILQFSADLSADTLVMGTSDPGKLSRLLLGSVASAVSRDAPCPVLIVRKKRESHPNQPEILPPCPDCVATRKATAGKEFWCERHQSEHPKANTFYELPEPFAMGSMTFRL